MTRDPARASVPAGVEVVAGDFDDPASLQRAATGATSLFLLSAPGPTLPGHDKAMIDAARTAGVRRVVKVSAIRTDAMEAFRGGVLGAWHRPGEQAVRDSGMVWTLLRPTSFASNTLQWAAAIRAGDPVPDMTGAGQHGVVDPRDVAAVAVRTLTSPASPASPASPDHDGATYTLTGPELLTVADQAATLGRVLGRGVVTEDVPLAAAREQLRSYGMDDAFVEVAVTGYEFVRAGGNAVLTDDVRRVLGREPGSFEAWARDHRAAFASGLRGAPGSG
jgi:uncharacterized protein YbjT (DUF2867 family)